MTKSAAGRDRTAKREGEAPPAPDRLATPAIDSHCHLDLMQVDVDEIMTAAKAVGIERVVQIGIDVPSSRWSVELAASRDDVWAAVAVHPNEAHAADEEVWEQIAELAAAPRVVAVGRPDSTTSAPRKAAGGHRRSPSVGTSRLRSRPARP
jgi:TatD DNase family protein